MEEWLNRTAKGASVSDIQCRMRIRHLQTLEAYIQEVAALSALTELSDAFHFRIPPSVSIFEVLIHSYGDLEKRFQPCEALRLCSSLRPFGFPEGGVGLWPCLSALEQKLLQSVPVTSSVACNLP